MTENNQPPRTLREYAETHRDAIAAREFRSWANSRFALAGTVAHNALSTASMAAEILKGFDDQQR